MIATQTAASRAVTVAAAAASDINDQLTIIVCAAEEALASLEPGDPMRANLLEIRAASQRVVWKTSGLLNYANRRGCLPRASVTMERLITEDTVNDILESRRAY